jgi:hypothetical protein
MNDLDLVNRLLAETPEPSAAQLAPGRARLLAAAVVLAAAALIPALRPGAAGRTPRQGPVASIGARLTAQVLDTAAKTVGSAAAAGEPTPDQWIYARSVDVQTGTPTQYYEGWMTFDGAQTASYMPAGLSTKTGHCAGQPHLTQHAACIYLWSQTLPATPPGTGALAAFDDNITPQTAYNALAALPTSSSAALLDAVNAELAKAWAGQDYFGVTGTATTVPQREFAWLGLLLWNAYQAAPPSALAAVYQAIATIPGVAVDQHASDADGRPAIGVTDNGGRFELLLSPHTYQPTGLIQHTPAMKIVKPRLVSGKPKPGATVTRTIGPQTTSIAWIQIAQVSTPGRR